MSRNAASAPAPSLYLPDFCAPRCNGPLGFWTDLARTSMFLLWIGLTAAGLLCVLRRRLASTTAATSSAIVAAAMALLVALISLITFQLGQSQTIGSDALGSLFPQTLVPFLARNVGIALIITGVTLRIDGGVLNARPTWPLVPHKRSKAYNGFPLYSPPKFMVDE